MKKAKLAPKSAKRPKKQSRDLVVKEAIHERDGWKCLKCGRAYNLQACHFKPKGKYQNIRHLEDNVFTLCKGCHKFWWHGPDPHGVTEWFRARFPDRYETVMQLKDLPACDLRKMGVI